MSPNKLNQITVMQYGWPPEVTRELIEHVQALFDALSARGLISQGLFLAVPYHEATGPEACAFVRQVADVVFDPGISALLELRGELYEAFVMSLDRARQARKGPAELVEFLKRQGHGQDAAAKVVDAVYPRFRDIQEGTTTTNSFQPPNVLLLPEEYLPSFRVCGDGEPHPDEAHGYTMYGYWTILCKNYRQIVWHELLHLCFHVRDCYDQAKKTSTCGLKNCIMQWDPALVALDVLESGDWLCGTQQDQIRMWGIGKKS